MKIYTGYILWAWSGEFLLILISYSLLLCYLGSDQIINIVYEHCKVLSTISGLILGVSVVILICYYQSLDSDFGKYLAWRKVDDQFLRIFQYQTILPFLATVGPFAAVQIKVNILTHFIGILFLYTCINELSVITNIGHIIRLKQKFRREYDSMISDKKTE